VGHFDFLVIDETRDFDFLVIDETRDFEERRARDKMMKKH
jgi:hypothetical protein